MAYFIDPETVEEIQERADIVDVISQYVDLNKTGSNYRGLCPFHLEKTPSFTVSPEKKIYKCFGCGQGGSVINFVMSIEGLSFPEACTKLADMYGIEISSSSSYQQKTRDQNKVLYEINREVALYYMETLKKSTKAMAYLKSRDIDEKLIRRFGLGYSKDSWEDTVSFIKSKGYDLDQALAAGIIKKSDKDHYYDFFKDRIMFPIVDTRSRVIGFGGRVMGDAMPKYLNTGETRIYHKGSELYGLNLLKKNIRIPRLLLVEGYMDVIGLASAGIHGAVASLGTAFTTSQARLLKKYTDQVYIVYDGDQAGKEAAKAAVEIFHSIDFEPRVVDLGQDMDPEDYVKKYGKFQFSVKLDRALEGSNFLIQEKAKDLDLNMVEGKAELIRYIGNITKSIKSPIERELQIQKISKDFNISENALKREIFTRDQGTQVTIAEKDENQKKEYSTADKALIDILKLILENEDNYHYIKDKLEIKDIANVNLRELYLGLSNIIDRGDKLDKEDFLTYHRQNYIIDDQLYKILKDDRKDLKELDNHKLLDELISRVQNIDKKEEASEILKSIEDLEAKEVKSDQDIEEIKALLKQLMDVNK